MYLNTDVDEVRFHPI